MAHKGFFKPRNPHKYNGDPTQIFFRSSWEIKMMRRLDEDDNVLSWSSERIIIPYRDRATGRLRRYYPDFWFKRYDQKMFIVEVKPLKETVAPVKTPGKSEKRFITEAKTFATNQSKWEAARRFCDQRGWEFLVITERELGIAR